MNESGKRVILYFGSTSTSDRPRYWVPYSVLSLGSALDDGKFDVEIWDGNVLNREEVKKRLDAKNGVPLIFGVSAMTGGQLSDALWFTKAVRQTHPAVPVVWGGPTSTLIPELVFHDARPDIVVKGQGEGAFVDICTQLLENGKIVIVPDGSLMNSPKGIVSGKPSKLRSMNEFQAINWDLIDPEVYIENDEDIAPRTISYISSQGCQFRCAFCSDTRLFDYGYSFYDATRVYNDIKFMIENFGVSGVKFYDSHLFNRPTRVFEFSKLLVDNNVDCSWGGTVYPTVFNAMSDENLDLIASAGCKRLMIGLESASMETLKKIKKGARPEHALVIAERLARKNMIGSFTYIVGFHFETSDDIESTFAQAEHIASLYPQHRVEVNIFSPYPGTALYEQCLAETSFTPPTTLKGWSDYHTYQSNTPWTSKELETRVVTFNHKHKNAYYSIQESAIA